MDHARRSLAFAIAVAAWLTAAASVRGAGAANRSTARRFHPPPDAGRRGGRGHLGLGQRAGAARRSIRRSVRRLPGRPRASRSARRSPVRPPEPSGAAGVAATPRRRGRSLRADRRRSRQLRHPPVDRDRRRRHRQRRRHAGQGRRGRPRRRAGDRRSRSEGERYTLRGAWPRRGDRLRPRGVQRADGEARARLRYALTSATALEAEVGYARFLEGFSDPDTPAGAAERPGVDEFDAALGVEQRFGRLSARAHRLRRPRDPRGSAARGRRRRRRARSSTTPSSARGSAPAMRRAPACGRSPRWRSAGASSTRMRDDSGFARSSIWGELRGGLVIDRGEKLSGEVSLGYRREDLEDDRLEDLNVFLANAAILWSPRRLTEVRVDLTTDVSPTSTPDASALDPLCRHADARAQPDAARARRDRRRPLPTRTAIGDDFRDLTFTGFADVSYAFNRVASVVGALRIRAHRPQRDGRRFRRARGGVRLRLQR